MLRELVASYLDSLSERDFDAPLIALLASQGFSDIHFIHGSFEFGKDVIAKKKSRSGEVYQYAIQSKAGNINSGQWREVRPQLEEAEYNTRAHPSFDQSLPRVAVLLTTGRLKGAAAIDSQEYRESATRRGLADFEVWDRATLSQWLCEDPEVGLLTSPSPVGLIELFAALAAGRIAEPDLERYSRDWLPGGGVTIARAAIEAAVIISELRRMGRLDLASYACLHLFRAATVTRDAETHGIQRAARRTFLGLVEDLLDAVEPYLETKEDLARSLFDPSGLVTYPVACLRLAELISLLSLCADEPAARARAKVALRSLVERHPGTSRPIADLFASSLIPITIAASSVDPHLALSFLRSVATWVLDAYDPQKSGLGLASIDETEDLAVARLLSGHLDIESVAARSSSYLIVVILDLCNWMGASELAGAVRRDAYALRIVPSMTRGAEAVAFWRRGGGAVVPLPRIDYPGPPEVPTHCGWDPGVRGVEALLLTASCRSRHYPFTFPELKSAGPAMAN